MANQNNQILTPQQVAYVNSQYGKLTLNKLARELKCSRNVITGHWRRYRQANNIESLRPPRDNDGRNDTIIELYKAGVLVSAIATQMQLSKSGVESVIKRMRRRLKLPPRPKPGRPKRFRVINENRVIGKNGKPLPFVAPPVPQVNGSHPIEFDALDLMPLSLRDGVCMCRHYVGNPEKTPILFCGEPSEPGRPYCEFHTMIAYRAVIAEPNTPEHRDRIKALAGDFLAWRKRSSAELREAA